MLLEKLTSVLFTEEGIVVLNSDVRMVRVKRTANVLVMEGADAAQKPIVQKAQLGQQIDV